MKATMYHNPKCKKSQLALEYLEKRNIEVEIKLYMKEGITRAELYDIVELLRTDIKDLVRRDDETIIDKYCGTVLLSKEGSVNAITAHPILLERPIILFREKAIGAMCKTQEALNSLLEHVGIKA